MTAIHPQSSLHNSNFTITHAMVIEAFHRTVGGRMFKHKKKMRNEDNMTYQFVIESKVGLGPSLKTPQPNNQSMDSHINCPTKFA